MPKKEGDIKSFEQSWKEHEESFYKHWTRGEPLNQIQFGFRNHWIVFKELLKNRHFNNGKRCLEIGCGRGTISAYFSDDGYDCTLLDISESVIEIAKEIFKKNSLKATFKVGNANNLPFENNSFDIVFSIGLLEHFEDVETPIKEQIRVLDKGGLFIAYVVPNYTENIQKEYNWINDILKGYISEYNKNSQPPKKEIYRSDDDSTKYIKILKKYNLKDINASGVYPLPMISHSIKFPFTLMPKESEKAIVKHFKKLLEKRRNETGKNPWLCKEGYGQAFLVWGFK